MQRPIDKAMGEERPEKQTIREFWLEKAAEFDQKFPGDEVPLYLTMAGSEGRDIELFAEMGLIKKTEVEGIAEVSKNRVVAIESNQMAVLSLQKKFPGLKILEKDIQSLLRGDSPIRYPEGEHLRFFQAHIVNLDFDISLQGREKDSELDFPVFTWIKKICKIHATGQRLDWCLFLTLNASITWPQKVGDRIKELMQENFGLSPVFEAQCRSVLGDTFLQGLNSEKALDFSGNELTDEARQKFLMTFVPKWIAQIVYKEGWRIETIKNLRYGGQAGRAAMVTWMIAFVRDERGTSTPHKVYKESLRGILSSAGRVTEDGKVEIIKVNIPENVSSQRPSHVFISYVRENRDQVQRLAQELEKHGVKVWLDRNQIAPGLRWKDAIKKAITEGDFFIACFSAEYTAKGRTYMTAELYIAIEELRLRPTDKAWFIPVLLSECDVPSMPIGGEATLRDLQWVELYKDWDEGIERILSVILPPKQT